MSTARLLVGAAVVCGLVVTGCSTRVPGTASAVADSTVADSAAPADTSAAATPDADPAGALPRACSLLTLPEATTLAGTPLDPATGAGQDGAESLCQYTGPTTGPTAQVEVFVGDGAKKILDIDRQLGHTITPLPGTGDEAYEEDGNVFVRKGAVWAAVQLVRLNDPAENRDPLRRAAAQVVGRL